MNIIKKLLIFFVFILCSPNYPCFAQDLYDYEHSIAFAEHLLDTQAVFLGHF
jgi:hypothetical protein